MKISVVINNCNNALYIEDCVTSVINQSRTPNEVIVIDDGSSDDSLFLLRRIAEKSSLVTVITQANQGQISAVANGLEVATGDILTLLDGDDTYKVSYLEELERIYTSNPKTDFVFCRFEPFGSEPYCKNAIPTWLTQDYDFGYTLALTYLNYRGYIPYNVTSTLSLSKRLKQKLMFVDLAKIHYGVPADTPLALGAALCQGRKYYLHKHLVNYRHHEKNYWGAKSLSELSEKPYLVETSLSAIFNFYIGKRFISEHQIEFVSREIALIPKPKKEHLLMYWNLIAPLSFLFRIRCLIIILKTLFQRYYIQDISKVS